MVGLRRWQNAKRVAGQVDHERLRRWMCAAESQRGTHTGRTVGGGNVSVREICYGRLVSVPSFWSYLRCERLDTPSGLDRENEVKSAQNSKRIKLKPTLLVTTHPAYRTHGILPSYPIRRA